MTYEPRPEHRMSLQVTRQGEVVVIEVDGQLIVGNRQELKQRVLEEAEGGARKILVDFAKAGYIDSSGLALFIEMLQQIQAYRGQLALFGLRAPVRHIFEIARLDQIKAGAKPDAKADAKGGDATGGKK